MALSIARGLTLALALTLVTNAASAAVPIPKPKPVLKVTNPEAAFDAMLSSASKSSPVATAYAPAGAAATAVAAPRRDEAALYLVGKLTEAGQPINSGLVWRIYREMPGPDGNLPLVMRRTGGDAEVRLKPGRYIVHASYGRATMSRTVSVLEPANSETFVLNAGGLQLQAVMDADTETAMNDATFEIYMIEGDDRRMIGTAEPGTIARLPAGAYHVVSRFGDVNAVRSADVEVVAGKLTHVALRHRAGQIRLKLVRSEGGEALADTAWTVYSDDGEAIFKRIGAYANLTLAAGQYSLVARHRGEEFPREFVVQSGADKDVVVLATEL